MNHDDIYLAAVLIYSGSLCQNEDHSWTDHYETFNSAVATAIAISDEVTKQLGKEEGR